MEISRKGQRATRTPKLFMWDGVNDVFPYGKYEGKTITEVLINDPAYIVWMYKESSSLCIAPIIFEKVNQKNIRINLPLEIINKVQENYINHQNESEQLTGIKEKKTDELENDEFVCVLLDEEEQSSEDIVPIESKIQPIQKFVAEEKKYKGNTTLITTHYYNTLTQEQKNESGGLGEEIAFKSLVNDFHNKYEGSQIIEEENKTIISNGGFIHAEIIWISKIEKYSAFDIQVIDKLDGEFFYEVKSTFSENKDWFDISINEWEFAQEKGDKYHILRVSNLKSENPDIIDYQNPYKLFQEGQVSIRSLQLEL